MVVDEAADEPVAVVITPMPPQQQRLTRLRASLIEQLGFAYDSSYSDTAPFEPQAGGCCKSCPSSHAGTVEPGKVICRALALLVGAQGVDGVDAF